MDRLIIISNRLPFSLDRQGDKINIRQSSGGLVSAIKSYFESEGSQKSELTERLWFGVADFPQEDWDLVAASQDQNQDFNIVPLFVDNEVYDKYYNGFSNSVIWPLFHYFSSLARYETAYFEAYKRMNQIFAEKIAPLLQPGDKIWIHDYQLMLLPQLLRTRIPDITVGFFLHIPFPSYEIFRLLPSEWKKTLLEGVMGADLIGFHTYDYVQHFIQSVKMLLGVDNYFRTLLYQGRLVKVDLFPIGIDYKKFNQAAYDHDILESRNEIRRNFDEKKIVFSVDRLDYTKGMMHRLNGFEYFLENYPEWREKMVFILNIVPSRDTIPAYTERKKLIEEKISAVNGRFSTISWQPLIYRYNHLAFNELLALYQAADAALITPLRDGMNLVAKEYVASCATQHGVLILSELAGAASELSEALLVNPTDVTDVAGAIARAFTMPVYEQRNRLSQMQRRLQEYDVLKWVNDFLEQLTQVRIEQQKQEVRLLDDRSIVQMRRHYQRASNRCLLLDYDGTLVPFTRNPTEAHPGAALTDLLRRLSSDPKNNIVVISGRDASSLDRWLGALPLTLVAEHGASFKKKNDNWQQLVSVSDLWKEEIRRIMQIFVIRCAGSFVEEKANTIAWHYRNTAPDFGFSRSRELLNNLSSLVQNTTLQVVDGNKVVEVRLSGFDKGITALKIVNEMDPDFVLCIGDDTTDEDMFKALEGEAYTVKVSAGASAAQYSILSQQQVIPFLGILSTPNALTEKEYAGS
ncbi:MAG: bifunctional alpha,alpha-trehalose-phosphate synthase (UDP-forming)/trehalose-phosphatase [Puia sp.]|nr:bifunctional alpha,alpha-trehalose-phosphate synthase (UDP-forming)/trehalose-phosphatase [Puia sp.]